MIVATIHPPPHPHPGHLGQGTYPASTRADSVPLQQISGSNDSYEARAMILISSSWLQRKSRRQPLDPPDALILIYSETAALTACDSSGIQDRCLR